MYKLNYFNFEKRKNKYLITNDLGKFAFLDEKEFKNLVSRKPLKDEEELKEKCFIYDEDMELFANRAGYGVRKQKNYLFSSTALHIFVVTKNCNFNCVYCQAGNLSLKDDYKMSKEVAKKAVDIALSSKNQMLSLEFQGGEPLLNYEIIKYIIEYSQANAQDKKISYNIVSNLTLLTSDMMNFFKEHNVDICTSIDGDEEIQNKNRIYKNENSYKKTVEKIKILQANEIPVSAIETTTKYSLGKYKEIVDEYVKLGFKEIFIRPLTALGKASNSWNLIGYTPEEFVEFYGKCLKYILQLNKENKGKIIERQAVLFLKKIIENNPQNYMELRSPCGGAIGQLAYYYNGDIYTCDEARMMSEMGNDSFKLGNVNDNTFEDLMESKTTEALCISSCVECLKSCYSCVYMPYCGVCPVVNLAQENNIFSNKAENYRCKINKGIINILFEYIEKNDEDFEIMKSWLE